MTQGNLSQTLAVNIPPTLILTVTHEQFVQLALANRDLQLEQPSLVSIVASLMQQ